VSRLCASAGAQYVRWTGTLFGGGAYTLACWGRWTSGQGGFQLGGEPSNAASAAYTSLWVDTTNGIVSANCDHQTGISSQSKAQTGVGVVLLASGWYHLAGVFGGPASRQCYVNGVQQATSSENEGTAWPGFGMVEVCRLNTNAAGATGTVAEAAIWSAALSAAELLALTRGAPPTRIRPTALALYWPLWGVAATEPDLSGNGRNGTVTGATRADHAPVGR
jgi:hypothetical protein